jgi:hypothetical protein
MSHGKYYILLCLSLIGGIAPQTQAADSRPLPSWLKPFEERTVSASADAQAAAQSEGISRKERMEQRRLFREKQLEQGYPALNISKNGQKQAEEATIERLQNGEAIEFPVFSEEQMRDLKAKAFSRNMVDAQKGLKPENSRENFNKKANEITAERRFVGFQPNSYSQDYASNNDEKKDDSESAFASNSRPVTPPARTATHPALSAARVVSCNDFMRLLTASALIWGLQNGNN